MSALMQPHGVERRGEVIAW